MDTEDLKFTLERTTELIRNADNKNSILVAVAGILAAILFTNIEFPFKVIDTIKAGTCCSRLSLICAAVSALGFIISIFLSILPKTKTQEHSCIYAGEVAKEKSLNAYKTTLNADNYDFNSDLINQIYVNSIIFKRKCLLNRVSAVTLFFFILFIVIYSLCQVGGI